MATFLLCHAHTPGECRYAFAAWKGFDSPLRGTAVTSSCRQGGHSLWWSVEAGDEQAALDQLPPYVAERTNAIQVSEVTVP